MSKNKLNMSMQGPSPITIRYCRYQNSGIIMLMKFVIVIVSLLLSMLVATESTVLIDAFQINTILSSNSIQMKHQQHINHLLLFIDNSLIPQRSQIITTRIQPRKAWITVRASTTNSIDNDTQQQETETETVSTGNRIKDSKKQLFSLIKTKASIEAITKAVRDVEKAGIEMNIGQDSSISGLLSGEWELVYSSTDITRSSPFFWAFRKAFPEQSNQIYDITDMIPSGIKDVGPAFKVIDISTMSKYSSTSAAASTVSTSTAVGRFVSRVKVATLGGIATSIMTTRGTVLGINANTSIRIQIDTTKPERSTIVQTILGQSIGSVIDESLPPFPSGPALERIVPGSSIVTIRTL
jgi:hypothetical protein